MKKKIYIIGYPNDPKVKGMPVYLKDCGITTEFPVTDFPEDAKWFPSIEAVYHFMQHRGHLIGAKDNAHLKAKIYELKEETKWKTIDTERSWQ